MEAQVVGDDDGSSFVVPETDDEAEVDFAEGDERSPIWGSGGNRLLSVVTLAQVSQAQLECLENAPGYMDEASVGITLERGMLAFSECGGLGIFPENTLIQFADGFGVVSGGTLSEIVLQIRCEQADGIENDVDGQVDCPASLDDDPVGMGLDDDPVGMVLDMPNDEFLSSLSSEQAACLREAPGYMDEASVGITLKRGLTAFTECSRLGIFLEDTVIQFADGFGIITEGEFVRLNSQNEGRYIIEFTQGNGLGDFPINDLFDSAGDDRYHGFSTQQATCLENIPGYMDEASVGITLIRGLTAFSECGGLGIFPEGALLVFTDGLGTVINDDFAEVSGIVFNAGDGIVFDGGNGIVSDGGDGYGIITAPTSDFSEPQAACLENIPGYMDEASVGITLKRGLTAFSECGGLGIFLEGVLLSFSDGIAIVLGDSFAEVSGIMSDGGWLDIRGASLRDDSVGAGSEGAGSEELQDDSTGAGIGEGEDGNVKEGQIEDSVSFCGFPTDLSSVQTSCLLDSLGSEVLEGLRTPDNAQCEAAKSACFSR
jgi:hypothetical protein